jgi:hypothetical protein
MATASYNPSPAPANRPRRSFGVGILPIPTGPRSHVSVPPSGPGWFDPARDTIDSHPDRLTLTELLGRGGWPTTWPNPDAQAARTNELAPRGPVARDTVIEYGPGGHKIVRTGMVFDAYLDGIASELLAQPGPHAKWLGGKVAELARRARFNDAHDGATFDEREAAWDAADSWATTEAR